MSTDWNLHCVDCKVTHRVDDANHMREAMRMLAKHAPAVAALAPLLAAAGCDLCFAVGYGGRNVQIDAQWFVAHAGHNLQPIDEYGHLDGACGDWIPCTACGSPRHRCVLDDGHEGACAKERT